MSKHFMVLIAKGIIILGIIGLVGGICILAFTDKTEAGTACLVIGSNALSVLAGIAVAPKHQPGEEDPPAETTKGASP